MQFKEFLERYGIPYQESDSHRHVRHNWIGIDCPWCGRGTHKFHMGFNLSHHYLNCWRCGNHRLIPTMVELTGIWPSRIKQELEGLERVKEPERRAHKGKYQPPKKLEPLSRRHKVYLRRRGFHPTQLAYLWGLRSIGLHSRLSWRIFIPIVFHGQAVSWTTRTTANSTSRRYISASSEEESVPHKQVLYGWDYVRHACCIVEGPTDVWKVGPGAVATLGLQFTPEQVELLGTVSRRVICFDNEPAAQRRARKLRDELVGLPGETLVVRLDSADPGSASDDEIRELRALLK